MSEARLAHATATTSEQEALVELARIVLGQETLGAILQRVAEIAKATIPGAEEVSLTVIRGGRPSTPAFTGPLALEADEMQYEQGHGPCMDSARAGLAFHVPDMRAEGRWPDYAPRVASRGVLSSVSLPLPVQDQVIGALNLYATAPHAFGEEAVGFGGSIAGYAAVAVANAHVYADAEQQARQLQDAMASRATIDQAKGIVMAERRCSPDEAFKILTQVSQHSNRKLRDVAAALVERAQQG
jgi:GAF domain-containing protein